jgi:hypothetical protein
MTIRVGIIRIIKCQTLCHRLIFWAVRGCAAAGRPSHRLSPVTTHQRPHICTLSAESFWLQTLATTTVRQFTLETGHYLDRRARDLSEQGPVWPPHLQLWTAAIRRPKCLLDSGKPARTAVSLTAMPSATPCTSIPDAFHHAAGVRRLVW